MAELKTPVSAYLETHGVRYFPRMLSKIRLFAAGQLREDFHESLGRGMDSWFCEFARIGYDALRQRTSEGGNDEEIFAWVQETGRGLEAIDIRVWNHFISKVGWNDEMAPRLAFRKNEAGIADRDDVLTMIDVFEIDEGRRT